MTRRGWVQALVGAAVVAMALISPSVVEATDFYSPGSWGALASDRLASRVGDTLTVVIDESSTASDSSANGAKKTSHFGGQVGANATSYAGSLDLGSGFDGSGQTQRTHKMVGQLSVTVDAVLPNGDLHVVGEQAMKINGAHTNIRVKGRVRLADISSDNTVLSTRLADATIDYDGAGFIEKNNRPGLLTRLFSFVGLP